MLFTFKDSSNKQKKPQIREKAAKIGLENISTPELLALLLETGTRTHSVSQVAQAITRSAPSLRDLASFSTEKLKELHGVGQSKSWRLAAAFELGRRCFEPASPLPQITKPSDAIALCSDICSHTKEHVIALYLDARQRVLTKDTIAIGTLNQASIEPRDVFSQALTLPCNAIILVHNHPSGNPNPSQEDIDFTKTLIEIGSWLGIHVLDHLIVCKTSHVSLLELGHIPKSTPS